MSDEDRKARFYQLIRRGENYLKYPRQRKGSGARIWQNACAKWLQENAPDLNLAESVLLVTPPKDDYWGNGLSAATQKSVQRILKVLYSARDLLPLLEPDEIRRIPKPENSRKVFVVHGHNDLLKISVARFLEKLGLEPIILHEQPDLGRTIIEKFIDHSDVAYAVVLLTADDLGSKASEAHENFRYRARQNVILELGFFIGRLGRKAVAAIHQEEVEIPSDYSGVLFIPYDTSRDWQLRLARELKASGLPVDLNKIV